MSMINDIIVAKVASVAASDDVVGMFPLRQPVWGIRGDGCVLRHWNIVWRKTNICLVYNLFHELNKQ